MKMRIMIGSDLAPPVIGGAERYVINLGSRLADLGNKVHWLTSLISNTSREENYSGINIHRIRIFLTKNYRFVGRLTYALTSILPGIKLAQKMDVLQFNTFVAGVSGWLIAKLARKPAVLFCHEFFGPRWKYLGQNFLEKNFYPYVERLMVRMPYDAFACPSEYSKKTLIEAGAPEEKISVIPHGINFEIFNSSVSGENIREKHGLGKFKTFGYSGRLSLKKVAHAKNLMGLLKAAKIVLEKVPDARFVLGGSGYENIYPAIRELGIEDKVVYAGERPFEEIGQFYGALDVTVCPALSEGFCFLTAEALACGRPTVATALGAHNERIIDKKTGLLTGKQPEELAVAIISLLNDRTAARPLGENAAKWSKRLTWENSVKKHLELYQEVIDKQKKKKS